MARSLILATVLLAGCASAPRPAQPADPVPNAGMTTDALTVPSPDSAGRAEAPKLARRLPSPVPSPSPTGTRPAPTAMPRTATPPRHAISGVATWYCGRVCTAGYPGGMYAAAGSELRVGDWRGRVVTVTARGRSVRVRLIDACACRGDRVIDLYAAAFARLAPVGRGVIPVEVSW